MGYVIEQCFWVGTVIFQVVVVLSSWCFYQVGVFIELVFCFCFVFHRVVIVLLVSPLLNHTHLQYNRMSRIHKDIAKLYKSPPPDCLLDTSGEDLQEDGLASVFVYLLGPESTPYYGGAWQIMLKIPSEYPRVAPKAWFVSKIFHPNVEPSSGEICVDTLKRDWSPSVDLSHILLVCLWRMRFKMCTNSVFRQSGV